MTESALKLTDPKRGQKVFLKTLPAASKDILCTYLVTVKDLIFHYLRWIGERLVTDEPDHAERARLTQIERRLRAGYAALLPTAAEKRWAEKHRIHMDPVPTAVDVSVELEAMARALRNIPEEELQDFLALLIYIWGEAGHAADDPAWVVEFTGSELMELNFFHRLVVLVYRRLTGELDDTTLSEAAFGYAQRPLRRDHFYHTDNSVETFRSALEKLNFRMRETMLLIFRDFFDHLETFSAEEREGLRAGSRKNLSPENYEYVQSTLANLKVIVDEARAAHPGTARDRFDALRYIVNFEAVLNALRKRAIYGHSFEYAFPLVTPMQVCYLAAGKLHAPEDSIFFDFTRLILNPDIDRMAHKRIVTRPAFAGTVVVDPMKLN